MRALVLILVLAKLVSCGKSDSKANAKVAEAPSLSSDGTHKVPPGYETTFKFGTREVKLEYTWLAIGNVYGGPALSIFAQGSGMGLFKMMAPIPAHTPSLTALAGYPTPAFPDGVSFGLTEDMAVGNGADIRITEVTATHVSGTFTTQACPHARRGCKNPTNVSGSFKAYRSALSDDAAFELHTKKQ